MRRRRSSQMKKFETFRDVIELWPTRVALADDIGLDQRAISKWWQRDSIAAEWWGPVSRLPPAQEAGVTVMTLAEIYARSKAQC